MIGRILLTGAKGFLGQRVHARLLGEGHDVVAPDRSSLDVTQPLADFGEVKTVIHLAARTFVPHAWEEPGLFLRVNVGGTVNVLDYCRRTGAGLVFVSAYCYGQPDLLPISEDAPLRPSNPYAFSKISAEEVCRFYESTFGVPVVVLRPFNLYGPGQDMRFLIPNIMRQVLERDCPSVELTDARPRRDYIHVDDVVTAIVLAARRSEGARTYNVGSGSSYSVREVARLIMECARVSKPIVDLGKIRENEILDTVADISAIGRDLGWQPTLDFERGLRALVADAANG